MKILLHRIHNDEKWKLITHVDGIEYNFNKKYYISNYGNVKNDNMYMKPSLRGNYYRVKLSYTDENNENKSKTFAIHRLVCEYFCKSNINNLPTVDHIDGNSKNNYYKNLEWCSYSDQVKRAHNLGLLYVPYGEECHFAIIDENMAKNICKLLSKGMSTSEIRNELNLSTKYSEIISHIRRRTSWNWISKDYEFSTKAPSSGYIPDNILHEICKMIVNKSSFKEVYKKYKIYFNKFKNPKAKFNDIKTKRSYKRISDLYF